MNQDRAHVMGWGYEGHAVEDLVRDCKAWGATTVVDVRLNPVSRRKGFSKKTLAAALESNGISYVHMRALGNPQDNRPGFATPTAPEGLAAHQRFVAEVLSTDDAQHALTEIDRLARDGTVVLLCFEASESCCHRSLVRKALGDLQRLAFAS